MLDIDSFMFTETKLDGSSLVSRLKLKVLARHLD